MDTSFQIKIAEEADLPAYYKHLKRILLEQNGKNGIPHFSPREDLPPKEKYLEKFYTSLKEKSPTNILFLAMKDNIIAGNLLLSKYDVKSLSHRRLIGGLGVDIAFHNQGIAKALIQDCLTYLENDKSAELLELGVTFENKVAISVYEKFGFKIIASIDDEFRIDGKKIGCHTMQRELKKAP